MFSLQYHFKVTFNTSMMKKVFVLINCECKSSWSLLHILPPFPFPFFFFLIFVSSLFSERQRKLPRGLPTWSAQDLLVSLWASLVRSSIFPAGSETQRIPEDT